MTQGTQQVTQGSRYDLLVVGGGINGAGIARDAAADIRRRRVLVMMLGDTSMGMINGYFGPRLLNRHGFTEHKVDQAWIIDRGRGSGR